MIENQVEKLLEKLGTVRVDPDEIDAFRELVNLVSMKLPILLLEKYRMSKRWKVRAACVRYAKGFAQDAEAAVQLGIEALTDRSISARLEACALLAFSLNEKALGPLKEIYETTSCEYIREDAHAAMDAIRQKNHHYFLDRDHSGNSKWTVRRITEKTVIIS